MSPARPMLTRYGIPKKRSVSVLQQVGPYQLAAATAPDGQHEPGARSQETSPTAITRLPDRDPHSGRSRNRTTTGLWLILRTVIRLSFALLATPTIPNSPLPNSHTAAGTGIVPTSLRRKIHARKLLTLLSPARTPDRLCTSLVRRNTDHCSTLIY